MLGNTHTCSVCLTRVTVDQLNGVSCGHMFCGDCWDVYCQVQIQQGITTGKIKHILLNKGILFCLFDFILYVPSTIFQLYTVNGQ